MSEFAKAGTDDPRFHLDMIGLRRSLARNRRLTRADERAGFDQRYLTLQPSLDESKWKLWGELPAMEGKVIPTAFDELADKLPAAHMVNPSHAPLVGSMPCS